MLEQVRIKRGIFVSLVLTLFLGASLLLFLLGASLFAAAHPAAVTWQRQFLGLDQQQDEAQLTAAYLSGYLATDAFESRSFLYTQEELSHLKEARGVFDRIRRSLGGWFLFWVMLLGLTFFVLKKGSLRVLANALKLDLLLTLGLLLAVTFSFSSLFAQMHLVLFPQGGFLFPEDSLLIQLFPEAFFRLAAALVLLLTLALLLLALGVVKLIERR